MINMMCTRCKKRMAVVFMSRMEGDQTINEGLCIQCAKELGIKPVTDMVEQLGITDDELSEMTDNMSGLMEALESGKENGFEFGGAQTSSFLESLFGGAKASKKDNEDQEGGSDSDDNEKRKEKKHAKHFKFLEAHCENLTKKAAEGRIDRIIGRDREIYRVLQILNRRTKNNPCLIGEPGVGKTAIAEGIALRLAAGDVPQKLRDKELYLLDLTSLVAGTQFRGQFEGRVKGLVNDIKQAGNVILFIDEVHSLVGAGDADGSMNAANILKPALSRGEIQVIGATTFSEYRKYIEKDAALERRFQPVKVDEPNIADTIEVMKGIKAYYEDFHRVKVSDSIAEKAAVLSERYITDRFLPDKAIDLLDEACSCASLRSSVLYEYDKLIAERSTHQDYIEKSAYDAEPDYEKLAETRALILKLDEKIKELEPQTSEIVVNDEDLAKVIELWTGIPASKIQESEMQKVSQLEANLSSKVIGQDEAVSLVAAAIKRSRVQISGRRRPASFIFVGPTGVGKTELVKVMAGELFDSQEPLIRLDMSEYMEKHAVARIVGAPPGYVGHEEAGQLTEKVRRRPYSVVLFDEIEKAHPDVMNILLQILDEGRITDAQGRVVSFENCVIVMTSNAGSDIKSSSLGFNKAADDMTKERVHRALSDFLRPEFLGRVDEIVVFRNLTEDDFAKIAVLMLSELVEPLKEKGISFSWSDDVPALVAKKSIGGKSGARAIRKFIRKEVEDTICNLLVDNYAAPPTVIKATSENDEIKILSL